MQIRRNCPISNSQRADDIAFDFLKREEATKRIDQSVKKNNNNNNNNNNNKLRISPEFFLRVPVT